MDTTTQGRLPFVSCLCPTFHRPQLLANALACFLAQDYEGESELIILDDGGDFPFTGEPEPDGTWPMRLLKTVNSRDVWLISISRRYPSLPEKFNAIARQTTGQILLVWEDDDIYLQHHISSHVAALQASGAGYSKPSQVLSTYPGHVVTEQAAGRFHASIGFTSDLFAKVRGWPLTRRADFDQQFMSVLANAANRTADPCQHAPPSYCFRYGSTQAYHGQHFMQSPDDPDWYDRVPRQPGTGNLALHPKFDPETTAVYARHAGIKVA